jgi:glutathione synthase
MNLLFITDPVDGFKLDKDSSLAMMRQAQARGYAVWVCGTPDLQWQRGERVSAVMQRLQLKDHADGWYRIEETSAKALCEMDAVLMRKDPPFDSEYFYATHLLSQAEREGAKVFNQPSALREHPEKLALMEFAQWTTPTLVSRQAEAIRAFHAQHQDIILKPLDGMGGMGIFRVRADGLNLGSIIETLNRAGATSVMVQKFVPAIAQGDKRVLVIGGKPVPYALARIPQGNEVRGNLAAGGKGVAQALSPRDSEIAHAIGPTLAARGLLLVGLDIIGECLTEVNVTSPTCFREITDQTGFDVAAMFMDALTQALQYPKAAAGTSAP